MRRYVVLIVMFLACAGLLLWADMTMAQEEDQRDIMEPTRPASSRSEEPPPNNGYPVRKRLIGGPTDVEWDLDNSFPKQGSVWELILNRIDRSHN